MVNPPPPPAPLLLDRSRIRELLSLEELIAGVEAGFRRLGSGSPGESGVLGLHPDGGGFHVKAAVFADDEGDRWIAAKLNANYPANPRTRGLPTIQGLLGLFDARDGTPVAVMDSAEVTALRTAAATAVAVRHLARKDAGLLVAVGCGAQAESHVRAVSRVRRLTGVVLVDHDPAAAESLARRLEPALDCPFEVEPSGTSRLRDADVLVTLTPSTVPFVGPDDVAPGTLVAAVGADNERKSEIAPALMKAAAVVTDDRSQCARIGDLHHALVAGAMTIDDVRADLSDVVGGRVPAPDASGVVVFDSTGLPFQDVVAAALACRRAASIADMPRFRFAG